MRRVLILTAVAMAALSGCGVNDSFPLVGLDPDLTQIDYRFTDSSVPPEYHRSYELSARADGVTIVVDSYGDVLHEGTGSIDDATWQAVLRSVATLEIDSAGEPDGCVGGTSRELHVTGDADPLLDARVTVCDEKGAAVAAVIDAFVAPLLTPFDMEALLAPSN